MKINYVQKAVESYRSEFGTQKIDPEWLSTYYAEVLPVETRSLMSYEEFRHLVDRRIGPRVVKHRVAKHTRVKVRVHMKCF